MGTELIRRSSYRLLTLILLLLAGVGCAHRTEPAAQGVNLENDLQAAVQDVAACGRAGVRQAPDLEGDLLVSFVVESTGRVDEVLFSGRMSGDKQSFGRMKRCIERRIGDRQFAQPTEPMDVEIPLSVVAGRTRDFQVGLREMRR